MIIFVDSIYVDKIQVSRKQAQKGRYCLPFKNKEEFLPSLMFDCVFFGEFGEKKSC